MLSFSGIENIEISAARDYYRDFIFTSAASKEDEGKRKED